MSSVTDMSQYDASSDAALAAIETHDGPLLVDFDETLYLRNSTEDFIDCARPAVLAMLALRALDLLKPWRLTGGIATRDSWRVNAIRALFPWTFWYWRAKAGSLAEHHGNQDLKAALQQRERPPIILTAGFGPVVAPLLAAMGFSSAPLIAARMHSFADRRMGKLHMATRELGTEIVSRSLVITDSINDLDILQNCSRPLRTVWPEARYRRAFAGTYLPGEYISQIKRPGKRYIWHGIIQEDFAFWLLSSINLATNPAAHVAGLLLLLLSFWAIYERGYVENDLIASASEVDPRLSESFGRIPVATPVLEPWIWASVSAAVAVAVLYPGETAFTSHFAIWMAVLVAMYASFATYNRLDKKTRVWLYPLLQFWRSAAFAIMVPIELAGVGALGAIVISRWVPYIAYRQLDTTWPDTRPYLTRLVTFIVLAAILACSVGVSALVTWTALAMLLWNVFKARQDIYAVAASARRLDVRAPSVNPKSG